MLSGELVDLAKPYVKRSHEPSRAEDVPFELQRAYHTAMQHPRGPVFLSIPMDDWEVEVEPPVIREVSYRVAPEAGGLEEIAEAPGGGAEPGLVVGPGIGRAHTFEGVVALAEKLNAGVWQEPISALPGFPWNHRLFQGHLPAAQRKLAEKLSSHDVVLVLGAPVFTYYPYVPGLVARKARGSSRSPKTRRSGPGRRRHGRRRRPGTRGPQPYGAFAGGRPSRAAPPGAAQKTGSNLADVGGLRDERHLGGFGG